MGPYCAYCGQRCFTFIPADAPEAMVKAYSPGVTIIATCHEGMDVEERKTGWSYRKYKEWNKTNIHNQDRE